MWGFTITFSINYTVEGLIFLKVILVIMSIIVSAPTCLLIWFLNRKKTKMEFK
jgi:hypothetical protein